MTKKFSKKIITLVGLMGVGKTTLGSKLAEKLGYYFIDSDQEIEDRQKKPIKEIFSEEGEEFFRKIEKKVIEEIVLREERLVFSLGGGAFINDELRKFLKEKTLVIWLDASIDDILARVSGNNNRPLLRAPNKRKTLLDLAKKRAPIYSEAHLKFNSSSEKREAIINKIIKSLEK